MSLYVDQRWLGIHGIGRFAREVSARLSFDYNDLTRSGSPSSPLDVLAPARMRLRQGDVVYSPGYNAGLTRATQILTLHDLIHLDAKGPRAELLKAYYERVVRPTVTRAGSVITVSETSADAISAWLGTSRVRVVNVGNGCSDVFTAAGESASREGPYFLYVGNLKEHKNFDVLLRALKKRPHFRLIAVINDYASAATVIEASGLTRQVEVVSGLSDVELAQYYRGSIGLVMPSLTEGFGLPAVESLSCGRAVAYSKSCSSVAEIVGDFGVPVDRVQDGVSWAEAMDALSDGASAFQAPSSTWRDQYRWSNVAENINTHLAQILN
ncbi:glycosyltransferase family 4 protein [Arthrobacter sp. NPDC058097]|uniref:glycosyltransferase family 4 protein n=1 Tax=Arthrobacter sp. NPDC058097 TaxID=3346340 RepID=UPI0036DF3013